MRTYMFERNINEELFNKIFGEIYEDLSYGSNKIENRTFSLRPYDWKDETKNRLDEGGYNLWHKPSGFKLTWYKHPLRGAESNMKINHEQFRQILIHCKKSLNGCSEDYYPWWEDSNSDGNRKVKFESFCIKGFGPRIEAKSKEEFLEYLSEEINRIEELGVYNQFDVDVHFDYLERE